MHLLSINLSDLWFCRIQSTLLMHLSGGISANGPPRVGRNLQSLFTANSNFLVSASWARALVLAEIHVKKSG